MRLRPMAVSNDDLIIVILFIVIIGWRLPRLRMKPRGDLKVV